MLLLVKSKFATYSKIHFTHLQQYDKSIVFTLQEFKKYNNTPLSTIST